MTGQPWDDAPANYKSTDPDVLAAWDDTQRRFQEWREAKSAWAQQFPDHEALAVQGSDSVSVVGLQGDETPGPAWRQTTRANIELWVPDKRTKAGKAIAQQLDALSVDHMKDIPGMPDMAMSGNHWHSPGLFVYDGVAYVHWSCTFAEVEDSTRGWSRTAFDASKWERIKRSELYAAQEADEADKQASKAAAP